LDFDGSRQTKRSNKQELKVNSVLKRSISLRESTYSDVEIYTEQMVLWWAQSALAVSERELIYE
jgi:hypothetical protein